MTVKNTSSSPNHLSLGHAPSHLRDAAVEVLESCRNYSEVRALRPRLREIFRPLWVCSDIVPGGVCDNMDIPRGSTYAQLCRRLKTLEAI